MKRWSHASLSASLSASLLALACHGAHASTSYGDLNNFDTVNDTGQECHGFEIEIDGARSTDITYTYDWNHYGAPRIREDLSDPANPKVFVRYESAKNPDGTWASYTAVPAAPLAPTDGHSCTNPGVNDGCEHFGVGYYGAPTAIKYHWLLDDGAGNLVHGPAVNVATPTWTYVAPVPQDPALPPDPVANPVVQPAQVVAAIPAPVAPDPNGLRFGVPTWVKVIKTTTHNANPVALEELISDDTDGDGLAQWQNAEPAEVESEWRLLQANGGENAGLDQVQGLPDDMGDGDENVTRRYEFYAYAGDATTRDGETGEAMCSEVGPDGIHGVGTAVKVTDANGDSQYVDCEAQVVVGDYNGAQMAGFDADAPLGLVENLQNGEPGTPYTPRTVVVGGNTPYAIEVTGNLPQGMSLGDYTDAQTGATAAGALYGTPGADGSYDFTVSVTDADGTTVSRSYSLVIGNGAVQQFILSVSKAGSGSGTVSGSGIDCGATCTTTVGAGTAVSLSATPAAGSVFKGWTGACTGTGGCAVTLGADVTVGAVFEREYRLSVSASGTGSGSVSGNGIDCGASCATSVAAGTVVSLNATPTAGSVFKGWTGACTGTGTCLVTVTADASVGAVFDKNQYQLSVGKAGTGSGTVSGNGINCGTACTAMLDAGTAVSLTAAPAAGSVFSGWSGACSGTGTCNTTMDAAKSVTATFVPSTQKYSLSVTKTGLGTVSSSPKGISCGSTCSASFTSGTSVTLTATPARKHAFLGWSGGACSGTALTCTVTIRGNVSVTANFN